MLVTMAGWARSVARLSRCRPEVKAGQAVQVQQRQHLVDLEHPHLPAIEDPQTLRAELAVVRQHDNTIRLHALIGYGTPDDEHAGCGEAIRQAARPASRRPASAALPSDEQHAKIRPA